MHRGATPPALRIKGVRAEHFKGVATPTGPGGWEGFAYATCKGWVTHPGFHYVSQLGGSELRDVVKVHNPKGPQQGLGQASQQLTYLQAVVRRRSRSWLCWGWHLHRRHACSGSVGCGYVSAHIPTVLHTCAPPLYTPLPK